MPDEKMVKNEMYVENVWLRILVAFGIASVFPCPIFLGIILPSKPDGLSTVTYFLDMMSGNHWAIWTLAIWYLLLMSVGIEQMGLMEVPASSMSTQPSISSARPRGNFFIAFSHQLSKEEALKRIQGLLSDVKCKHGDKITDLEECWEDGVNTFQLTVQGYIVSGVLTVQPEQILLDGNIPFPASLAKGKIESVIREQMTTLLA